MKRFLFVAFLSLLASCASVGRAFDLDRVDQIVDGETTQAQILEWFGDPVSNQPVDLPDGTTALWTYVHATSFAGVTSQGHALCVQFDKNGIVIAKALKQS